MKLIFSSILLCLGLHCFVTIQALDCYTCGYVSGIVPPDEYKDLFDESCANGKTPHKRFAVECKLEPESNQRALYWSCGTMVVFGKLSNGTDIPETTLRSCIPSVLESAAQCENTTIKALKEDPRFAQLKETLEALDPEGITNPVQSSACLTKSVKDESGNTSSGYVIQVNALLLALILVFAKIANQL